MVRRVIRIVAEKRNIFVTGSTGFMGRALCALLVERGHRVRALVRRGSEKKAVKGCEVVVGDPLDASRREYPHVR